MAADQRRKRLNGANIAGFSTREQYRTKKKKPSSPDNSLNARYIGPEYNNYQKKVVAKRQQVGLSWRDLRPFVDSIPRIHNIVAAVAPVPAEIFELEDLSEVLSYKVWQTYLSQTERNFLKQFLPRGMDAEQVVQALLGGDNFHFGNPVIEWGRAICSGNLDPDAVLHQEQCLKADRKAYWSELQKYHFNMIDYLQKLKERWESCEDPENDIVQKMWGRSRGNASFTDGSHQNLEQDLTAGSESCSGNADEKPCSSDNKSSSVLRTGVLEKRCRTSEKAIKNVIYGSPLIASNDNAMNVGPQAGKKDKLQKHNINQNDGAKYMSYLKISKKQHQIVTSMKQSGKSIQSRSLNRILGNVNKLDVLPYEVFVEEEQKKLQAHWLQLTKDLPAAHAIWKEIQLHKHEIISSLERDLKDRLDPWVEDGGEQDAVNIIQDKNDVGSYTISDNAGEEHESVVLGQKDCIAAYQEHSMDDSGHHAQADSVQDESPLQGSSPCDGHEFEGKKVEHGLDSISDSPPLQSSTQVSSLNDGHDVKLNDMGDEPDSVPGLLPRQSSPWVYSSGSDHDVKLTDTEDMKDAIHSSPRDKPLLQASAPSGGHDFKQKDVEEDAYSVPGSLQTQSLLGFSSVSSGLAYSVPGSLSDHSLPKLDDAPSVMSERPGNQNVADVASSCGGPLSSGGNVWPAVGFGHSYIGSIASHQRYPSTSGLSLPHPQGNVEQKTCFVDLESDVEKRDGVKNLLQRQSDDGPFSSFPNQDRGELLQSLFKGQGVPSHNQDQLQALLKGPRMVSQNQEHKQMMGLDLPPPSDVLMDGCQFSGHFPEQLQPSLSLDQGQTRQNEAYIQENLPQNVYPDGNRYMMPRQEHLHPGGVQNWNVHSMRMQVPYQTQLNNGDLLNQNWLPGEHQLRNVMWTGSSDDSASSQGIQTGTSATDHSLQRVNNSDQSLFSVLSQCSQLRSGGSFDSERSNEQQFIAPGNYGMTGGDKPRMGNTLPQAANPLDYLGVGNPSTSLMPDDVDWMTQPHQNSSLHDPLGKLYPRSWNQ